MEAPLYYRNDDTTPQQDTAWLNALGSVLAEISTQLITTGVPSLPLKLVVGFFNEATANVTVDDITLDVMLTDDPNRIQVGEDLYALDTLLDSAASLTASVGLVALVGATPLGFLSLAVVGGVGYAYSKFVDAITDDILLTLNGKDTIQLFDSSDNHIAGLIYPDGFAGPATDAVYAFITHPNSQSIDFTGHKILVDNTVIGNDPDFTIVSADVLKDVAAQLGMTFEDFLVTSSGVRINDNNPLKVAA